jgi:hypothetical protein
MLRRVGKLVAFPSQQTSRFKDIVIHLEVSTLAYRTEVSVPVSKVGNNSLFCHFILSTDSQH